MTDPGPAHGTEPGNEEWVPTSPAPDGWTNWQAFNAGRPVTDAWEIGYFSDSSFIASVDGGLGPYQVLNCLPNPFGAPRARLAVALRVDNHLGGRLVPVTDIGVSEFSAYHGAGMDEEFASLFSLIFGVRFRSCGQIRWYPPNEDPRGRPLEAMRSDPSLPGFDPRHMMLPRAWRGSASEPRGGVESVDLRDTVHFLARYPRLGPADAAALVKAARQYQSALWIAEDDPALAWLMLVGAVETAAEHTLGKADRIERLQRALPEVATLLEECGPDALTRGAGLLAHLTKSTAKFIEFLLRFDPGPPDLRPDTVRQVDWSDLPRLLRDVYDWRSKALHAGTPIPGPMCRQPFTYPGDAAPEEGVSSLGEGVGNAFWAREAIPMRLHVFEHIVRGALIRWWETLAPPPSPTAL